MALTDKQRRFVDEYMVDLNATQAAIRAGYSKKTAQVQSSRLLSNAMIAEAVAAKAANTAEKLDLSAERVLRGLFEEATRLGEGASHAARVSAWGLLGKYHALFADKVEHDHKSSDGSMTPVFNIVAAPSGHFIAGPKEDEE